MKTSREVEDSFEAVPAYIVADKRDRFGRRLGTAAFIMLLLFFVIASYTQSARNGAQLDESRAQREKLILSQDRISKTLQGQGLLIIQLQEIITKQNKALRAAGLPVEPVPNLQNLIDSIVRSSARPRATSKPRASSARQSPTPRRSSKPGSKSKPKPSPSPSPKASPSPTRDPVTQFVCDKTGVCKRIADYTSPMMRYPLS